MPKLLLHICCAPDATHPLDLLDGSIEVTGCFFNPNIEPREEYEKRLGEMKRLSEILGIKLIEGEYTSEKWTSLKEGHEDDPEGGERCKICYEFRLEQTARIALENGFDYFSTTLTISPHKDADIINELGEKIAREVGGGIKHLPSNFKKKGGFESSLNLSKKHGLYRQNYCGCLVGKQKT